MLVSTWTRDCRESLYSLIGSPSKNESIRQALGGCEMKEIRDLLDQVIEVAGLNDETKLEQVKSKLLILILRRLDESHIEGRGRGKS